MEDQSAAAGEGNSSDGGRKSLEAEQIRWEIDKLEAKRRLLEEVVGLLQHDRAINGGVTRIVESMATLAERDPAPFWRERSTSGSPQAKLQFPLPPFPSFPFPPIPPFPPFPPPPFPLPMPGDVFGQVVDLIKAEKAMIQDLIKELLT